jgi:glycosyltransferase involved in cell wall biosynthesis
MHQAHNFSGRGDSQRKISQPEIEMHKVLHLMQCTNLGGMEQVTFRLMEGLVRDGASFRIATPRPFGLGVSRVRSFDPEARDFPYRGRFGWRDFPLFRRHVHALAADCSHIWVTGTSAASLAAIKGLRQPKVLSHHYHHFEGRWAWPRWRAFYELLCRDLDAITYPTRHTRNEAIQIAPWLSAKAKIVPNGITVNYVDESTRRAQQIAARRELGLPETAFVVGNAGWLIHRKRFDVFLTTAAKIKERIPEALFVICGGGEEESALRALANRLGIAESVRFVGWVKDLTPHYRSWDALLFNTDFDTLPTTPMEASAEGCLVVASQLYGGLGELIDHDRTGYLFPVHDVVKMTLALVAIHDDKKLSERLRVAAAEKLYNEFSLDRAVGFFTSFFSRNWSA